MADGDINTLAGHERAERLGWPCGGYLIAALGIGGLKYMLNINSMRQDLAQEQLGAVVFGIGEKFLG